MDLKWMAILGFTLLTGQAFAEGPLVLNTPTDRENYANGVTIARNLKQQGGAVNLDILIKGMMDELSGEKLGMTEDEIHKTVAGLQAEIARRQAQAAQAAMKRGEVKAKAGGGAASAQAASAGTYAAKKRAQVQKSGPEGQNARIAPATAGMAVAERYDARRGIKKRAAEMRRRTIEQERRKAAEGSRKAI